MSNESGEEVELRELFDPDDIVDRWIFMLAGVVADLATVESVFKEALHGDDAPPTHRFYLQRQLGARIVEADRVVLAIPGNREIQRFVKAVDAEEEAQWLVARFAKGEKEQSEIDATLREQRHRTVHHAKLNGTDLKDTLSLASDEAVWIERDEKNEREILEFPESVLTRFIFAGRDGKLDPATLRERAKLIEEVLGHFSALWWLVFPAQIERKGLDPARMYRIIR